MAANNFTPIQLYRTSTASATPSASNLADGELAINLTDETLYFKNASGDVKLLASNEGAEGSFVNVDVGDGSASAPSFSFTSDTDTGVFRAAPNQLGLSTGGTERMRIDASGRLLVGTSGPEGPAQASFVSTSSNTAAVSMRNTAGANGRLAFFLDANNTAQIGSVRNINNNSVAYNTSSDYRLKDIDGPITKSGKYIDALKPVQGKWKQDGSRFIGLIAHEVQEVSETPIATGEKDGEEMQSMDYSSSEIIANLIAEVQSLRSRLAKLEGN